jgi:hypothetical protein
MHAKSQVGRWELSVDGRGSAVAGANDLSCKVELAAGRYFGDDLYRKPGRPCRRVAKALEFLVALQELAETAGDLIADDFKSQLLVGRPVTVVGNMMYSHQHVRRVDGSAVQIPEVHDNILSQGASFFLSLGGVDCRGNELRKSLPDHLGGQLVLGKVHGVAAFVRQAPLQCAVNLDKDHQRSPLKIEGFFYLLKIYYKLKKTKTQVNGLRVY